MIVKRPNRGVFRRHIFVELSGKFMFIRKIALKLYQTMINVNKNKLSCSLSKLYFLKED